MKKHLKILLLGDSLSALNQIVSELKKSDLFFTPQFVNTKADFERLLSDFYPAIIIADLNFTELSPLEALNIAKNNSSQNSFIVLSESLADGYTETCIKAGADDYILKKDLPLLSIAIKSILDRKIITNIVSESQKPKENSLIKMYNDSNYAVSVMRLSDGKIVYINDKFAELFGYIDDEIFEGTSIEINIWAVIDDRRKLIEKIKTNKILNNYELKLRTNSGTIKDFQAKIELLEYDGESAALTYIIGNAETTIITKLVSGNEARFKSIAENSEDIISTHTSEGIFTYISPACRPLLGYHPEELIGHSAYEFFHKDDLEEFKKTHQLILTTPSSYRINYRIRKKDGSYSEVETIGKTLRAAEHGQFIEMLFTTRAIALETKIQEYKVDEEKSDHLEQIFDNVKTIIWRGNAQTYQYTFVNQYAEELLGYPVSEWISDPSFWIEHVHPDDRDYVYSLKSETTEPYYTCDYRMISKSGDVIWIRENVNTVSTALNISERIGSIINISDRKHAEEVLLEIQNRYQSFFENSNDGIIITTKEGQILATNLEACILFGRTETEMLQSGRKEIMDTSDPKLKEALDERLRNGKFKGELTCVRKDGSKFQADISTAMFIDKNGNEITNTIIRDITIKKQSENELKRKSLLLNGILENIPVAVYRLDFEGTYTESSGLGLQRLGLQDHELVGLSVYDTYPQFAPKIMNALHTDFEHLIASGEMNGGKWYYEHFVFREDDSQGLIGFAFDITDRKASEIALKASEEKFRSLSAFYPVGIFITDINGACTWTNNRMQRIAGVSSEQALGDGWHRNVHSEDKNILTTEWKEYARKGWAHPGSYRFIRPDGSFRWVKATTSPLFSDQGDLFGHVGTIEDITDKRQADISLIQSEQRYKSLVDNNPDGVYSIDLESNFTSVNKQFEELTGYSFEELKKIKFRGLLASGDISEFQDYVNNTLKGLNTSFQFDIKTSFGSIVKLNITKIPILLEDKIVGAYGIAKNVTGKVHAEEMLKQQNDELMKTNQELDQFVYSTSHDLRAPLTSVLGLIGLAKIEPDTEQQQLYLDKMSQSVHKLDRFIQDIINYSKNSRLEIKCEEVNLQTLINETVDNLKYIDGADRIDVRIKLDEKSEFFSDLGRLRVILSNIISNAVRYHNRSEILPFIEFSATVLEDVVYMEISDNGQGINPIHLEKIFEMFYRASQNSSGSGLGLYIVKESVLKLKGKISVKSELTKGTTFYIQIPNLKNQNAI